ncbi:glycosyltransferase family protein [Desulfococcaceae bacterium HSG7]|nr:glycosyltransferase family protein [Desulfococcaceae bacterium HSG7]
MAKIIYGVCGEGSGHSSRAREMARHLVKQGHLVKIVSYDRGIANLKDEFDVFETEGLHIASADNKVSKVKTFTHNLKKLRPGHKAVTALKENLFKTFKPDCVITDFEPMTAYLAGHYEIPLISLDNQHRLRYIKLPCPGRLKNDFRLTKNIIRAMVPKPDVSLITTFYYDKIKNDRTFAFPPILRQEVIDERPSDGAHILVYLSFGFDSFIKIIERFNRETFIVYGYDKHETHGALTYKPFSKKGFLRDLATSKAVMATAGFTLMTEAFYFRKPYLALPMAGQFEQEINGVLMEKMGYGKNMTRISEEAAGDFLYRLPDYKENLADYSAEDNTKITRKLDKLLKNDCRLLKKFQRDR